MEKKFACPVCGSVYTSNSNLIEHVKRCKSKGLVCEIAALPRLKAAKTKNEFKCNHCYKQFSRRLHFALHERRIHGILDSSSCKGTKKDSADEIALIPRLEASQSKGIVGEIASLPRLKAAKTKNGFKCNHCYKQFSRRLRLALHERRIHGILDSSSCEGTKKDRADEISPIPRLEASETNNEFKCNHCNKYFGKQIRLVLHERRVHKLLTSRSCKANKKNIKCSLCSFTDQERNVVLKHIEDLHDVKREREDLVFATMEAFIQWKEHTENDTNSKFVQTSGVRKNSKGEIKKSYACHRSGNYEPTGKGLRQLKTQGSRKINGLCPASIKLTISHDEKCSVHYIKTHVGHQNDLSHLVISQSARVSLGKKIAAKIPFEAILNDIHSSISDSKLDRLHLLTRKDLHNIKSAYNLSSDSVKYQIDGSGVEAWVKEMEKHGNSCVLFHKTQGFSNPSYTELSSDNFVLMIMNDAQCEKLKKYSSDCVCMCTTQGINSQGFELIILLVVDDIKQGFPCGFLITNRTDQYVLSLFLSKIREKSGILCPKVLMTDMAASFYNAWTDIMDKPPRRLYCSWDVNKAWHQGLNIIDSKEMREKVYKMVSSLMEEQDTSAFEVMLSEAIEYMCANEETEAFGCYFRDNYETNAAFWAYCYRLDCGPNTNVHIERVCQSLKHIYLHKRYFAKLDKAIHAIMTFVKDKLIDRLIVIHKGNLSTKIKGLRKRHAASLQLRRDVVTVESDNGWKLLSSSDYKEICAVQEIAPKCECQIVCPDCNVCIHWYSCTCVDSALKWNMCKHIHLVCCVRSESNKDNMIRSDETEPSVEVPLNSESHNDEIEIQVLLLGEESVKLNGPMGTQETEIQFLQLNEGSDEAPLNTESHINEMDILVLQLGDESGEINEPLCRLTQETGTQVLQLAEGSSDKINGPSCSLTHETQISQLSKDSDDISRLNLETKKADLKEYLNGIIDSFMNTAEIDAFKELLLPAIATVEFPKILKPTVLQQTNCAPAIQNMQ